MTFSPPQPPAPAHLPPAIPVRSYQPPANADITSDQLDYAGGVNPLGYKGHVFTRNGYAPSSTAGPSSSARTPAAARAAPRRQHYPVYDFGDEDPKAAPAPLPARPRVSAEREGAHGCGALVGPVSPFVGEVSLREVGASTLLSDALYVAWRVFVMALSLATLLITAIESRRWLGYVQGGVLTYAAVSAALFLYRALQYRRLCVDASVVQERTTHHGWDAMIFQGNTPLSALVFLGLVITNVVDDGSDRLTGPGYFLSVSSVMFIVLSACHVLDIFIVPVPFRLTYIVPITIYGMIFTLFGVSGTGSNKLGVILMLSLVAIVVSSLVLHLAGRFVYIIRHKTPIAAERRMGPIVQINDTV